MTGAVGAADQNIGAEACPNACFSAGTDIVAGEEARAGDRVGDHRPHHHAAAAEFDFEWVNCSYFFDLDRRTAGYFDSSELSSTGGPPMRAKGCCSRASWMRCAWACSKGRGLLRSAMASVATARA
jgi:hypothetical protein